MNPGLQGFLLTALEVMSALFIFVVGSVVLALLVLYLLDRRQTRDAILRNYPVLGHFRPLFERLGEFFRQYFFAMDREELPFNRAERNWVYRAARAEPGTVAFGSTRDLRSVGTVWFVSCPFPTLEEDAVAPRPVTVGDHCIQPYRTASFFNISGMSYGALSKPAVRALSRGAALAGAWLNTGEGGLAPWHLEGGCDLVFQIGTAKYGVRHPDGSLSAARLKEVAAHDTVRMFEIKLSQGAKPGKGGILPAAKVTEEIARIRGIPIHQDSLSPNRHPEIRGNAELLEMIARVREITGKPVGFKVVLGGQGWLDELFAEIVRRGSEWAPDFITVDGAEGGSGAAPQPLMDAMGLPLREALPLLVDKLVQYGLRERIRVVASGRLITPIGVAWALCMGADFVASARGPMFALGCIQAMRCHRNTCPTGITTHDPRFQQGLDPELKSLWVANYLRRVAHEVGMIAHSCGVREPRELRRRHCRVVTGDGRSRSLEELFPQPHSG